MKTKEKENSKLYVWSSVWGDMLLTEKEFKFMLEEKKRICEKYA